MLPVAVAGHQKLGQLLLLLRLPLLPWLPWVQPTVAAAPAAARAAPKLLAAVGSARPWDPGPVRHDRPTSRSSLRE